MKQVVVGAAGETDLRKLAHGGMRTIAPGNVCGLAYLRRFIRPPQTREHAAVLFFEAHQLGLTLDSDAEFVQPADQQALVFILGKDQRVRKRAQLPTHVLKRETRLVPAGCPKICGGSLVAALDNFFRQANLAVELECARLHADRARRRLHACPLVHDAHAHAQPRQPQGQHQPGRPRAHDEHLSLAR